MNNARGKPQVKAIDIDKLGRCACSQNEDEGNRQGQFQQPQTLGGECKVVTWQLPGHVGGANGSDRRW